VPATAKIDYKRELRELYAAGGEPVIVDVPDLAYLMIDGQGDPNADAGFAGAIGALYTVAYTAKFAIKRAPGGVDYAVMPLEGRFWAPDLATFKSDDKSSWSWTLMIMAPDQLTAEIFKSAQQTAMHKKSLEAIERLRLERFAEGRAAQVLHVGPYSAEGPTIERLHAFIADHGYERSGRHHEIYLSDPARTAPEKLKTIIRQPVSASG
jgi:hypothetical protein